MNLRKAITFAAAAAAGLLALTPTVQAASPTGADITQVAIGGNTTNGTEAITGIYKGGTATFNLLGFTTPCTSGTVGGNVTRGALASGGTGFTFSTLTLACPTAWGIGANIALNAGCTVNVAMGNEKVAPLNDNVHVGTTDSGLWTSGGTKPKVHNVLGRATVASKCVTVTLTSGSCTARADGNFQVQFNEAPKTVAGVTYQDLILNGGGIILRNQTAACGGLYTGGITLNQFAFNIRANSGGLIDFR